MSEELGLNSLTSTPMPTDDERLAAKMVDYAVYLSVYADCWNNATGMACDWLHESMEAARHESIDDPTDRCAASEFEMFKAIRIHLRNCHEEHARLNCLVGTSGERHK